MLLYADSKLTKLEELSRELNQNAQEAKNLLNPAHIKSALTQSFNDLESNTTTRIQKLQSNLTNTINTTLAQKSQELTSQNTANFSTKLREFFTDDKIKSIVSVSELKEKVSTDFLAQNTQNITNAIKEKLTPILVQSLSQTLQSTLEPTLQQEIKSTLEQNITERLESVFEQITVSEIPLTQEQITSIVGALLQDKNAMQTLRVEFSKSINEKLNTNTDLSQQIANQLSTKITEFLQVQVLDFKHFLLRTNVALAEQMQVISHAHNIIANKHLKDLEIEFQKELAKKREQYEQNPNAVRHNIYQTI